MKLWNVAVDEKPSVTLALASARFEGGKLQVLVRVHGARDVWMTIGENELLTITPGPAE